MGWPYIFIRNDDVWTMDRPFRFFFQQASKRSIPVVYAVIPGKMEPGLVRFLCRAKERTPKLLDIVQHGWVHANHSAVAGKKYEFGISRSLKAQREDIRLGQKKMRQAFGKLFTPAFVPPYHGYDERTFRVLHEEGFQIFSAGRRSFQKEKRFIEMPAQVPFSRYDQSQRSVHSARDILETLARRIYRRPLSGVLMHHVDFATPALRRELTRFFDCIKALEIREGWRVLLFSEYLRVGNGIGKLE
ncbi:MAG: DUF2334 domain-containing protein [Candidatus Omnitrophica bacterium]|nr:DUF2334 domain-containing protein [Candidatus Omnitrophota bacterium]